MLCVDIIVPKENMTTEVIAVLGWDGKDVFVVSEKYPGAGSSFLDEEYEIRDEEYISAKDGIVFLAILYVFVNGFFCVASKAYEKNI